jgi:hypothetical protein
MIKINNNIRFLFIILILVSNLQNIFAQKQKQIAIYGYVLDSNNIPISNVNIIDSKTKNGTSTNKNGYFFFKIKNEETTIIVSHIGYKSLNYNYQKKNKDSLNLVFFLNKGYSVLAPVTINSKTTNLVYSKPNYYIYDFEFYESNILLLINHKKKNELLYLDEDNDTLSVLNTNNGIGLIKDCLGNIQVISKDSIYQIYIDEDDFIYQVFSFPFDSYVTQLVPCVASFDSLLLFVKYSINKQSEIYYYYDSKHKQHVLKQITNSFKNKDANNELFRIKQLEYEVMKNDTARMSKEKTLLEKGRELFQRKAYYEFILTKPIYNPIFIINDSIFLFDHLNKCCYVYDKTLTLSRFFDINYCIEKGWAQKLFIDKITNKVYAKFEQNGLITLKEINLINGSTVKYSKLENCIFPLKIGVNNGYIYFLQNENYGFYKTKLYRQRLN